MALDQSKIDNLVNYLEKASAASQDEDVVASFTKIIESIGNAKKVMADNEEKYAYLLDACTRWANQLTFMLFREEKLTKELEAEFRAFTPVADTTAKVKEFQSARQTVVDEVNERHAEIIKEQKGLDIFQAIIGGMSKEEAETKLEEYNQKMAEAQGR